MTKYIKNLLKLSLIVSLLVACSLTGKARLESSVKDITDMLEQAIKDAKGKGIKLEDLEEGRTGAKVAGPEIKEAKKSVIKLSEKFLQEIKEEANILKENAGMDKVDKDQLLKDMYDLMIKAAGALQKLGLQDMIKTVEDANAETPATTIDGILAIASKMNDKLQKIKVKQDRNK
ncbi:decorin-binding protein DbpA [Borreliella bavariensis]|uniref:decorin-binding protein DbpA n=1 Tax=Borreliella bavariensis TaxID=664662 RepID=UPI001C001112|nr:decorin-binding protein DbpA [Borreliella bavariensis]